MANKQFVRPATGAKLGGVCAAIANYFGLDVTMVRVMYALLTFFTASGLFWVYLILWLVLPQEGK